MQVCYETAVAGVFETSRGQRRISAAYAAGGSAIRSRRDLLDLIEFKLDLENLLGCKVDVVTEAGLSPYLRECRPL
jgi:hypothetical protein